MKHFKHPEMTVSRRFSDFLGLHEKLVARYQSRGIVIPPPPEKSVVGMRLQLQLQSYTVQQKLFSEEPSSVIGLSEKVSLQLRLELPATDVDVDLH